MSGEGEKGVSGKGSVKRKIKVGEWAEARKSFDFAEDQKGRSMRWEKKKGDDDDKSQIRW